jgi:acyl carrier protein
MTGVMNSLRDCLPVDLRTLPMDSSTSFESLGMDSLDHVEFLNNVEAAFGIEIPNREAKQMRTIQQVEEWLRTHKS